MRCRNVSAVLVAVVILSSFSVIVTIVPDNVKATTLFVGGAGPGNFTTIQSAIDASSPGGGIFVYNGTYFESLWINKTVSLLGESNITTIINGSVLGQAINVTADWVNISGFAIEGVLAPSGIGIGMFSADNCRIDYIRTLGIAHGVLLQYSDNNRIAHNVLSNPHSGIKLRYSNGNVVANNTVSSLGTGIQLEDSDLNVITGNSAGNSVSGGGTGLNVVYSKGNEISFNHFFDNRDGLSIWQSNNSTIVGNNISHNWDLGMRLRHSSHLTLIDNIMFENGIHMFGYQLLEWTTHSIDTSNMVNGKPVRFWKNATGGVVPPDTGQVILANCSNIIVNRFDFRNVSVGVLLGFSDNNTVSENRIRGSTYGIRIDFSNNNDVHDNEIANDWEGIYLIHSRNNVVSENTVHSIKDYAMNLAVSENNTVHNNTIFDSSYGFRLSNLPGSGFNVIRNNTVSNCAIGMSVRGSNDSIIQNSVHENRRGILLGQAEEVLVDGNTIFNNDFDGIKTWFNSGYNTFSNNIIESNGNGTSLWGGGNNSIICNTFISNTGYGIQLGSVSNSVVYHNNIIDNGQQAYDDSDTNQWDDGYPSGGNYWSDYGGDDQFGGVNQDLPGSDGLGDMPYIIDADSEDRYPSMSVCGIVPPRPPTITGAILSGMSLENVNISWNLSPDDGRGLGTVIGYQVYWNLSYDPQGLGYQFLSSLPNGASEFIDNLAGEGDPADYFYRLCAVALNNLTSCSMTQGGKFTRSHSVGPTLASTPLIQMDEGIETVFRTLNWDKAWSYNSSTLDWEWMMKFKPYSRHLDTVNLSTGIWVNVTQVSNLTVAGIVPTATTIELKAGWNLVGFPSFSTTYTVADMKADTGATRVEGYDPSSPPYFLRELQDSETLSAGNGYWIFVPADVIWTVSSS